MKKRTLVILLLIIIIVLVIFGIKKANNSKINYDIAKIEEYNYVKYNDNGKFGVLDKDGNTIVDAKYSDIIIPNPTEDIFVCINGEGQKNTILNSSNEELFSEYENVEPVKLKNIASILCYEKSVLKYQKDGLYGLIDFEGKKLTKNIYTSIENLQSTEGKFLVNKDNKYGIVNLKGKVLVKCEYDEIKTDGYYTEQEGYKKSGFIVSNKTDDGYRYSYINYKGKTLLEEKYNDIVRITQLDDIYLVASENGQYGLYKNAKEIIEPQYQSITYGEKEIMLVERNKKYGIVNLSGRTLIDIKYDNIEIKGMYLYAESTNQNQVFDFNGNEVSMNFNKEIYETDNQDYRVITLINNDITYYGVEDAKGATLVNSKYRYLEYVYGNYFIARNDDGKLGVIDSKDKTVIDFKYDMIQRIKNKNLLQALETTDYKTEIYSDNLEVLCTMQNAIIENEDEYIKVYNNDKEEIYFDKEGNKIEANSQLVQDNKVQGLPEKIGKYEKVQYSLENAYYVEVEQ